MAHAYFSTDRLEDARTKDTQLRTSPEVLFIHLRRWDPVSLRRSAVGVRVDGRLSLGGTIRYDLFGVVHHLGTSALCGHYVSDVRMGETWFRCNDTRVAPIGSPATAGTSTTAYICAYRLSVV